MTLALHLLKRVRSDARLAYLIGPGSKTFEMACAQVALDTGKPVDDVRSEMSLRLIAEPWPSENAIQQRIDEAVAKALSEKGQS